MMLYPFESNLTLASLESRVGLADHVGTATTADNLAIRMTVL